MIYKLYLCYFLLIVTNLNCYATENFNVKKDTYAVNTKKPQYEGIIKKTITYQDSIGEHLVLFSQKNSFSIEKPNASRMDSHRVYVASYVQDGKDLQLEWSVKDGIDCPGLDSDAGFFISQIKVDDANNDGVAEVYIPYYYFCSGDIDSKTIKIIMRSKEKKLAARGESKVILNNKSLFGGELRLDKDLELIENTYFRKNILEIWGEIYEDRH